VRSIIGGENRTYRQVVDDIDDVYSDILFCIIFIPGINSIY
jgi:hypothetical protein